MRCDVPPNSSRRRLPAVLKIQLGALCILTLVRTGRRSSRRGCAADVGAHSRHPWHRALTGRSTRWHGQLPTAVKRAAQPRGHEAGASGESGSRVERTLPRGRRSRPAATPAARRERTAATGRVVRGRPCHGVNGCPSASPRTATKRGDSPNAAPFGPAPEGACLFRPGGRALVSWRGTKPESHGDEMKRWNTQEIVAGITPLVQGQAKVHTTGPGGDYEAASWSSTVTATRRTGTTTRS